MDHIKKLEMALECLLNEEDSKAEDLLHDFFVAKARGILSQLEENENPFGSEDAESDMADEIGGEEMYSDDELDADETGETVDDMDGETSEERLEDIEDAIAELQAEFASLVASEGEDESEESDEDFGGESDESDDDEDDDVADEVEDDEDELEAEEMHEAVELQSVPNVKPSEGQAVGSDSTGGGSTTVNDKSTFLQNSGKKGVEGVTQTLAPKASTEQQKDTSDSNSNEPSGKGKGVPSGTGEVHNRLSGKADSTYKRDKKQPIKKDTSGNKGDKSADSLVSGKKIR